MIERRRRLMMGKDNYLEGWQMDKGLSTIGDEISQVGNILSPYFYGVSGKTLYFRVWKGERPVKSYNAIEGFDTSGNVIVRRNQYLDNGTISYSNFIADRLRVVCRASDIDDCYIYDMSNAHYIFAGKNIDTSTPPQ